MAWNAETYRHSSGVYLCVIRSTQQGIPEYLLREHLLTAHGKKPSWLEEQGEDLRVAHLLEHGFHRADHELTEGLREPAGAGGRFSRSTRRPRSA